ncbi:hypothetical protein HK405_011881 [Cladochytrium tenue]|nr:hypothetical protein HK405_011881 [Cladochytrium tenue]
MIGVALIGAGIFAREEHLPAIQACPLLALKAVYSRSHESAAALAALATKPDCKIDVFCHSLGVDGQDAGLSSLLSRPDIAAVVVALPILQQPAVIRAAIAAGKHVLSEKPVAGTVAAARDLLAWYDALPGGTRPFWGVAENYRFKRSLQFAAEKIAELGGSVNTFALRGFSFVEPDNKYFNTPWRKEPAYQGGFLLDGGVHQVAGLRMLLAAASLRIARVSAFGALLEDRLRPLDTLHAAVATNDGRAAGVVSISYATEFRSGLDIEIVTTRGTVTWTPTEVKVVTKDASDSGKTAEETRIFENDRGVATEMVAFAECARDRGAPETGLSPREALRDLELLEALLDSASSGAPVVL